MPVKLQDNFQKINVETQNRANLITFVTQLIACYIMQPRVEEEKLPNINLISWQI